MRREQLEHVLRAACTIANTDAALVIGSQAILGSFSDEVLPDAAVRSVEVDVTFLDDPADERSDQVDGAIGELSQFHETFGYYAPPAPPRLDYGDHHVVQGPRRESARPTLLACAG